jgi:5'-3' exonuclease
MPKNSDTKIPIAKKQRKPRVKKPEESPNNYLLVDNSYYIFYRFHATGLWYKRAQEKDEVEFDDIFVNKFTKLFFQNLETLKKTHGVPTNNIILGIDCSRSDNWRLPFYPKYKGTRKCNNDVGKMFSHFNSNIKQQMIDQGMHMLKHCSAEADDVLAISKKYIRNKNPNAKIIIITGDHDYLQLIDDNTKIYTLKKKNNLLNDKTEGSAELDLKLKILMGDKSDNINACFPKCGKVTALKLLKDPVKFKNKMENPKVKACYELNRKIIDFNYIPKEIVDDVIMKIEKFNLELNN